jgi:hypothetical protein
VLYIEGFGDIGSGSKLQIDLYGGVGEELVWPLVPQKVDEQCVFSKSNYLYHQIVSRFLNVPLN